MKYPIAIGLTLLAMAAVAGVSSDHSVSVAAAAKPAKAEVVPLNDDYRPPAKRSGSNKGPSLRCWQYGRLIFEEPMSEMPASLGGTGQRFEGRTGSLQLVDMHNSSCLIK
jgi:hypothetical protein